MRRWAPVAVFVACCAAAPDAVGGADAPAIGVEPLQPVSVDAGFHARFTRLLDDGFQRQTNTVSDALARSQSLQTSRPDDPRIEYALALISLKNFQQTEAIAHLEAAIQVDPAYLPAWRLLLGLQLKGREYQKLTERLYELADVVGGAAEAPPPQQVREQTAEYLGRVVAFLQGPLGDYEVAEQACRLAQNLDALLGEDLHEAYTAGRIALTREHHALLDEEQVLIAAAQVDQAQQLADAEAEGAQLESERDNVKRTQEQWDAIIKEEVGEIDSKLEALKKRNDSVQQEQTALSEAITVVRVEMQRLAALRDSALREGTRERPANARGIDVRLAALELELNQYLSQYDAASQEQAQILQAANGLMGQRQKSIARYQQATGRAADRIKQLDRWTDRVEATAEATKRQPADDARSVNVLRRRTRTWTTYDNFDLDAEKTRLMAEYAIVP